MVTCYKKKIGKNEKEGALILLQGLSCANRFNNKNYKFSLLMKKTNKEPNRREDKN